MFLAIYAAVMGVLALRHRFVIGAVGVGLFGVIGAWAAASRRSGAPWHVVLPSVVGAAAGIGALWLLRRSFDRPPVDGTATADGDRTSATDRRQFLYRSGTLLGGLAAGAALFGGVGRWLGGRFTATESRADVVLPTAAEPLRRAAADGRRRRRGDDPVRHAERQVLPHRHGAHRAPGPHRGLHADDQGHGRQGDLRCPTTTCWPAR